MQRYIRIELVEAEPAYRYKGIVYSGNGIMPLDEEPEEGYRVRYPDGSVNWCSKDAFEKEYRPFYK